MGLPKEGDNVHERNNRWALYSALARGIDKVRLITFWDGKVEGARELDARLVRHMVELMREMGGVVERVKLLPPEAAAEKSPSNGRRSKKPGRRKE